MARKLRPDVDWARAVYNGLDCVATALVWEALTSDLGEVAARVYRAEQALRWAALSVSMRGLRVDRAELRRVRDELAERADVLAAQLNTLAGGNLNLNSPPQLQALFYERLRVLPITNKHGKVSTDSTVLQRIAKGNFRLAKDAPKGRQERADLKARAVLAAKTLLEYREATKLLQSYKVVLHNGRLRTSYNVSATETWRWSASKTPFGDGLNAQNQPKSFRRAIVPDPGYKLGQGDQEQAESRAVAYLANDQRYIRAHHRGDLHTEVCRLLWPEREWTGDDKHDRAMAERPNQIGRYSLRDIAKRCAHGSSYGASPTTIARLLGISVKEAAEAQERFFDAFPRVRVWQREIANALKERGVIEGPQGAYARRFYGRVWDWATVREALAFLPQSIVAWTNHLAFFRLWRAEEELDVQVLGHCHDSVLIQHRPCADRQRVLQLCDIRWSLPGGEMRAVWDWRFNGDCWSDV